MAQGRCLFLFTTVLCSVSCLKVFPKDGTTVTLASGFNAKSSPIAPPVFTTENGAAADTAVKHTILPQQIDATSELKTELPSLAKYTLAPPIYATIEPTPKLVATKIEPSSKVTSDVIDAIAPTSVVKISVLQTFDVPAVDLLPPKEH